MENAPRIALLENGLDFIFSSLEYLESDDPRILRYACFNLCQGVELILEARLAGEHWSLLFEHPGGANPDAFNTGDFKAIDFGTCLYRLQNVVDLSLGAHVQVTNRLRRLRRQLEQFEYEGTREEVLSILVKSWDFALEFIESHLRDSARKQSASVEDITEQMAGFEKTIQTRLDAIQGDINYLWGTTRPILKCPRCLQDTFVVRGAPDKPSCLYCNYTAQPEVAAHLWCLEFPGVGSPAETGMSPRQFKCPECDKPTLIQPEYGGDGAPRPGWVCFSCGKTWGGDAIYSCQCCGHLFQRSAGGDIVCPACKRFGIEHR
ncbi:MAG: hypothetical protein HY673_21630 [Chloroflexi bacterium]|nr:hypothetical protein [Chloroflexota bacterium]